MEKQNYIHNIYLFGPPSQPEIFYSLCHAPSHLEMHTHTHTRVCVNVKSIANQASLIDSYSSDALSAQSHKHSAPK